MATYEVSELQTHTSSVTLDGRRYTREFRVISDTKVHPFIASSKIPVVVGSFFPSDSLARCTDISAQVERPEDSRVIYRVTATYETKSGSGGQQEENENPLDDIPVKRWSSRQRRLPVRFHINQGEENPQPITNSVGEPPDPLPEEDFQILVFDYQRNLATYNENQAKEYRGAINSDNVVIAGLNVDPYQARITALSAVSAERNGIRYWDTSLTIEIVDDWRLILPDEGLRKIAPPATTSDEPKYLGNGQFGEVVPILDGYGNPVSAPVLLDGNGNLLPDGSDPVFLTFSTVAKPELPFSVLQLPVDSNP